MSDVEDLFAATWQDMYGTEVLEQYKPETVKYVAEFGDTTGIRKYLKSRGLQNFALDFVWYPDTIKVCMEIQGHGFGHTGAGAERDRRKLRQLTFDGWKLLQYSATEVADHPQIICEQIHEFIESLK